MRRSDAITGSIQGAVLALLAITLMTLPSLARADWSEAINVSGPGSSTSQTRIAGGVDGNSWVVWKREVAGHNVIQGTSVTPDGSQGAIVTLSDPAADATDPVIKAWDDGSALVGWIDTSAVDHAVVTVSITNEGTVGAPVTRSIPGPVGQPAKSVALAVGGYTDKTSAVSWLKYNGTHWIVQAVKIAADGSSGTVHSISDPSSSAKEPTVAAAIGSVDVPIENVYRLAWVQGAGSEGNVYSRQIDAKDELEKEKNEAGEVIGEKIYKVILPRKRTEQSGPFGLGPGGNPQDVRLAYGSDGELYLAWVRDRTDYIVNGLDDTFSKDPFAPNRKPEEQKTYDDDPLDSPYTGRTIEIVRSSSGVLNKQSPLAVNALTPFGPDISYPIVDFAMESVAGGNPVMAWVRELAGGQRRVLTGRVRSNGSFQNWQEGSQPLDGLKDPVIAANRFDAAVVGWNAPGLLPFENRVDLRRFSNSFLGGFELAGDFEQSVDVGLVMADSGFTLAGFTALDSASQGTSRVLTFTREKLSATQTSQNFGRVNIGAKYVRPLSFRSSGETPTEITGISLSGSSSYLVEGADRCVRVLLPGANCTLDIVFSPSSTQVENAKITVNSTDGVREIDLTGSGLNRTRNHLSVSPASRMVRKGNMVNLKVNAANIGGVSSNATKVCARLNQKVLKLQGRRCRQIGSLVAGASREMTFKVRVTGRLKPGAKRTVMFKLTSDNAIIRQVVAQVGRKRR